MSPLSWARATLLAVAGAGCASAPASSTSRGPTGPHAVAQPEVLGPRAARGWLRTDGRYIKDSSGRVFAGRGANVHDTRSCDACAFQPPSADEVIRRVDALVDDWGADFVRLLLESYPDDPSKGRAHYANATGDPAYLADIVRIVRHIQAKPGVYVLLSVWHDPTLSPLGWPTDATVSLWKALAAALRADSSVIFGVVNEPQKNEDGQRDADVWQAMNGVVQAIRDVEGDGPNHLVAVQGTRSYGRSLDYYMTRPIAAGRGANVVYETHVYNTRDEFDRLLVRPARALPVIVGELGPVDQDANMPIADCERLMDLASGLHVPWLAYTFHFRCPPNLLVEPGGASVGCGIGVPLIPTPWGRIVRDRLRRR